MIILVIGGCVGRGKDVERHAYHHAMDKYDKLYVGVSDWLKENITGHYRYFEEYEHNLNYVSCIIGIVFNDDTDAMAFRLTWC